MGLQSSDCEQPRRGGTIIAYGCAAQAALARAVDAGQHVMARRRDNRDPGTRFALAARATLLGGQSRKCFGLLARRFHGGAAQFLRRGVEGCGHAFFCIGRLHAREQSLKLPAEGIEVARALAH